MRRKGGVDSKSGRKEGNGRVVKEWIERRK